MARATVHGEIWVAEVDKRRPVVVTSRDDRRGLRQRTTVATITSTVRRIPSEVEVDERDGIDAASAVNCDELWTIDKSRLLRRIGQLSGARLADLHRALRFAHAIPRGD